MNSESKNFLDEFERNESRRQLDEVSYEDILYGTELYEKILGLPDEIAVSQYITNLRQIAKKFKLTADFDNRVKPYRDKALKQLKEVFKPDIIMIKHEFPEWWDGENINEDIFCEALLAEHKLFCINGIFFDIDGEYAMNALMRDIYERINPYVIRNVADRTKRLFEVMKIKCYQTAPDPDEDTIHVKNGSLRLADGRFVFSPEKNFTMNRLDISYAPDAPEPAIWLKFLSELLGEQDALTLQEYMGYLLIPATRSQSMLMIIGNGGEGKSRVGKILFEMMGGKNAVSGSVAGLDNGSAARFNKVKLLGRLCMIDDDMDISALEKTDFLKQLISAEIPVEIEPKGQPSFQAMLYSRVIAFGNSPLSALYDHSHGFFRRQIILNAKPLPKNRTNDKHLTEKLLAEKEGIFLWCLQGLERLIARDFEFTLSEQAKQNLIESERESNNIIPFMESEHNFRFDPEGQIHSQELYRAYESWCQLNNLDCLARRTFTALMKKHCSEYGLIYTEHAANSENKRARGFIGARYNFKSSIIKY